LLTLDREISTGASLPRPSRIAWLLLAPLLIWLAAFVVAPTVILLIYSFCQRDEFGDVVFRFSLENYSRAFESTYLWILLRSVWYALLTTMICIVAGYPVAYFIGRLQQPWRSRLLMLVMIPFWTSFLIRTYAWLLILGREGFLNSTLSWLRLISAPFDLLYTWKAVVIGLVYTYLPFMILPIYGSVEKLDESLIEAAMDLGAGPFKAFARVILPLTTPGIAAGALVVFVPAIAMFAVTDLMGGAKVPMIGNVIQNQFGQGNDWPFGAALGMVLMAMFAIAYALSARIINRRGGAQLQ
jgi:spermidine/putrescine transport system permease protein